jgi:hypothetical protein
LAPLRAPLALAKAQTISYP